MADELLSPEEMNDLLKQGTESAEKAERTKEKKAEVSSEADAKKNRKLRELKNLYPDVNIKLFYRKDFRKLLEKFGIAE
jgi:flagellar motor switch protein FliM